MKKISTIIILLLSVMLTGFAGEKNDSAQYVTSEYSGLKGFVNRILDYFNEANEPHPEKKLDISFIGGPHYSKDSGFGVGIVGSGLYYTKRNEEGMPDPGTPPSLVSLKIDVATSPLYKISTNGYHIFGSDKFRINYSGYFYWFRDKFWGIGYKYDANNANRSNVTRLQSQIRADFVANIKNKFYIGPLAQFSYVNALKVGNIELFQGQALRTVTTGLGVTAVFDTRDVPYNAFKGVFIRFDQLFNPQFLGNKYAFSQSVLDVSGYTQIWKGGVLAALYHADLTFGNTPWGLLPSFGGSSRMRGYFEGRYRDKCEMDATLELRQHVWRRSGVVVWVGAGSVFPNFESFRWYRVLPNFGVGYRWQFKPRMNVRIDIGFGKHEKDINFSINEAF